MEVSYLVGSTNQESMSKRSQYTAPKGKQDYRFIRTEKQCVECESLFLGTKCMNYCSEKCSYIHTKRISRATRKAILKGCEVVDIINPITVFIAYNWTCNSCGDPTPRSLIGSHDPSAPTIDHIIPLFLKGPHSYDNIQCLCRRCNVHKGIKLQTTRGVKSLGMHSPETARHSNFSARNVENRNSAT